MTATARRTGAAKVMADVTHDVRGAVGTIRLAVTTLLDGDDDADLRRQLLEAVDAEAAHLTTDLAALAPLVAALTDKSKPARVDVVDALRHAGVEVASTTPLLIDARPASFDQALAALVRVIGATTATVGVGNVVRLAGARRRTDSRVVDHLATALGATVDDDTAGLALAFAT